jgi:hypothetical protein
VVVGWITSGRLSVEWIDHRRSVWLRDVLAT